MKWLAFSFAAGAAGAFGFEPVGIWPVTVLAVAALMFLVARAPTLRGALARGWWFGVGHFLLGLNWIATAFTFQAAMPAWLGWVAVVLLSLYLAVYPAAAAGLAWRYGRARPLVFGLVFAAAWIVTEWLRGTVFTGFPWNPLGVALIDTPVAQAATLVGTYGLAALLVLVAGALLALAQHRWRTAGLLALAPLLAGIWGLLPRDEGPAGPLVRIVQPNISQAEKWRPDFVAQNYARLIATSGPPQDEPRLLLWPEVAIPDLLESGYPPLAYDEPPEQVRARLAALLGPRDILLTGAHALDFAPDGRLAGVRNSVFAMDSAGRLLGRYDKAHLTPYGEYLPMRPLLSAIGVSRLAPGDYDTTPGPGPRSLRLPGFGLVGVQTCYEIVFPGQVVDREHRPAILFNPSNDAWFGTWGPPQHLAQARLRALEEGLPILRSTPTGISAVIDAEGRLLQQLGWRKRGFIDARVPPARPPTPFARFGNWLSFAFALLLAGAAIAVGRKAR
ncbi:MAG: apolipoprotein N-acyltransferase [Pseudomonadota bacterium]|nr:apolipoprotein N-acyltransferase [Pseudomonadota bacterium]